jgi:prophage antirepressor-like protein
MKKGIKIFDEKQVRTLWDEDTEEWYFSIIDVVEALTDTDRPRKYWNDLKKKLQKEGSELSENIGQFKMVAPDGKKRITDVASTDQLFRLIQSIPSPKAEPFKLWIAQVAKERLDQMQDPELSIEQAMMGCCCLTMSKR